MTNPKFESRTLAKKAGWFSRRHETSGAHQASHIAYDLRGERPQPVMRTVDAQIAELDKRLGKGVGAQKERAKLERQRSQ